jgi:N-acetylglucosamine-6-phosphate deacetylase
MIVITGAVVVLPDRVVDEGSVLIEGDRITGIETRSIDPPPHAVHIDARGAMLLPGFIDVHVHGVEGVDVLDGPGAVASVAARLPKYGVTAFCPTTVACPPAMLDTMLDELRSLSLPGTMSARVLPAHLESNFINLEYKGAQPAACLRSPVVRHQSSVNSRQSSVNSGDSGDSGDCAFSGGDILRVIERRRDQIGIVTVAPEIEGGLDLVQQLSVAGHRVSIGHSGATYEQAVDAIAAGVTHATHLFNRMSPLLHRAPGVPGAVLQSEAVGAELICDSFHVHPALLRVAIQAKGIGGVLAITDGTAGSGLAVGSRTRLGGRAIIVTERTAELEDGTIAGSVLTMDGAFRVLVGKVGLSVVAAARLCSTTPAERLRLAGMGRLVIGGLADLAILDRDTLRLRSTVLNGQIWRNTAGPAIV